MNRTLAAVLHRIGRPRACLARGEDAGRRLDAARLRFDGSVTTLCKAALDHVDGQDLASRVLRASLARLAQRAEAAA